MVQRADNCSNFNIIDALLDRNLFHLVEDIFVRLDSQSLTNAENSSNHWSQFIQLSGRLYRKKMATISSWLFIDAAVEKTGNGKTGSGKMNKNSNRHSIFIRTVSSLRMLSALLSWLKPVLWDIWTEQLKVNKFQNELMKSYFGRNDEF